MSGCHTSQTKNFFRLFIVVMILLSNNVVLADALDDGKAAFENDDYITAAKNFKIAAAQGNADGQNNLGWMYHEGLGVEQDYKEAMKWYTLAAAQGHKTAKNNIGMIYYIGDGFPQNFEKALKIFKPLAAQGFPSACNNLGWMYFSGQGVKRNYLLAHMWLNIAASMGRESAIENRAVVEVEMTQEQIAKAQKMADVCVKSNFKKCSNVSL